MRTDYDDPDPWLGHCSVVVRCVTRDDTEKGKSPTFKLAVKGKYLIGYVRRS